MSLGWYQDHRSKRISQNIQTPRIYEAASQRRATPSYELVVLVLQKVLMCLNNAKDYPLQTLRIELRTFCVPKHVCCNVVLDRNHNR
jgi:hypothetical protein